MDIFQVEYIDQLMLWLCLLRLDTRGSAYPALRGTPVVDTDPIDGLVQLAQDLVEAR